MKKATKNIALIGVFAGAIALLLTLIQPHLSTSFAQAGITGKFCNVQQNSGWWLWFTIDNSTDPCGIILDRYCTGPGCRVVSSGTYSLTGRNNVRVSCQGFNSSFSGNGDAPLRQAYDSVANPFRPACNFQVTSSASANPPVSERNRNIAAIPLFQKPFSGNFPTSNPFDHDVPQQFRDNNGYVVNWRGDRKSAGTLGASIDGHEGYDWLMPEGTPLLTVAPGVVSFAGEGQPFSCPPLENRTVTGLYLYIIHTAPNGERFQTEYVHLSRIGVQNGQLVRSGQQIGLSGNTGCSTAPHLHFGVRRLTNTNNGQPTLIDPYGWSGNNPDPWSQNSNGANSVMLWKKGQAPRIFNP